MDQPEAFGPPGLGHGTINIFFLFVWGFFFPFFLSDHPHPPSPEGRTSIVSGLVRDFGIWAFYHTSLGKNPKHASYPKESYTRIFGRTKPETIEGAAFWA